jgi:hypothetical protein
MSIASPWANCAAASNCVALPAVTAGTIVELRNLPLLPHPSCGAGPVRAFSVSARVSPAGLLAIEYELHGDLRQLRLAPVNARAQRRDGLWRHTCFEMFACRGVQAAYLEFNFSPSGDWAAYEFESYRRGQRTLAQRQIGVALRLVSADELQLHAHAELSAARNWQLRPAAVIEAGDGSLSYWAAEHGGTQPDFHRTGAPAPAA